MNICLLLIRCTSENTCWLDVDLIIKACHMSDWTLASNQPGSIISLISWSDDSFNSSIKKIQLHNRVRAQVSTKLSFSMCAFLHRNGLCGKIYKFHNLCFSVERENWAPQIVAAWRENLPLFHLKPSFWRWCLLLALQDNSDSKDEHDDSESDAAASRGDEHNDDHDLLLLPMRASSLSTTHMLAISQRQ